MQETVNKVPKMKNTSSKKAIKVLSLLSAVLVTFILFSYYLVEGHGIFISLASSLLVALLVYGFVLICLQQLLGQNGKEFKAPGSFTSNKNNRISLVNAPDDIESLKKLTDYVVLDTETTGLSPEKDQVVEIGIITVKNGEITNEYTSLIKPTIPISSEATAINGISESDLRDAPQLEDIIPDVVSRIKNQIVVGHNVTFDLAFVSRAISDHTEIASISYIDTVKVARNCIPGKSYKLQSLANRLCLDTGTAHRALDDAKTTNSLLQYCIRKMTTDEVVEGIRKTDLGKSIYEKRKETIERVFADAKEKHSMRYTHMRGLTRVTQWVRLKFAAMNLKKLANWAWKRLCLQAFGKYFWIFEAADGCCAA